MKRHTATSGLLGPIVSRVRGSPESCQTPDFRGFTTVESKNSTQGIVR